MNLAESRRALDAEAVRTALENAQWHGPQPDLRGAVGSTNDEATALARAGAPEGSSVVAEEQTAGRGRADRTWTSPPGAGLWLSFVVRPGDIAVDRWTWLPLLAGLAAADAARTAGVPAEVKWPNDVVMAIAACGGNGGVRKLGGVLSEVVGDAVVLGIGLNVGMPSTDLPVPNATSLYAEGGDIDRVALLAALLPALTRRLAQWRAHDPALTSDYRTACSTIGRIVDIDLPGGGKLSGVVDGIDDTGRLLVDDTESLRAVAAGDVIHATI